MQAKRPRTSSVIWCPGMSLQEVRHIDNEGFYDYQVARPMICSVQGRKRIIWPQTTFYDIAVSPMLHLLAQIAPRTQLPVGGILQADATCRRRL